MAISVKDAETDRLAREVAALTGETLTEAIRTSLAERLTRERRRLAPSRAGLAERLKALGRDCAALPDLDTRSADEIIGYDDLGVPALMVIDTSAILAMLLDEPEADDFERLVEADPVVLVSAVSRVEATFVIEGRKGDAGRLRLSRFFEMVGAEVVPLSADQAEVACEAFRRYGKGRHPASLNFGDVFAYALAKTTGEPLLFMGDDFSRTDLSSVAGIR